MTDLATCPACGQTKPTAEFNRNRSAKSGHSTDCSACISVRRKKQHASLSPSAKADIAARAHARHVSGANDVRNAQWRAARKVQRRLVRVTCFWHLVALIYLGPLAVALRAQDDAKRRAACGRARAWYYANPEQATATARAYRKANPGQHQAYSRAYYCAKLNAVPAWAGHAVIARVYDLAILLTEHSGEQWHVDHIVPLQHPLVCGFHCEANLRPLPAKMNMAKSNRFWPDMP